MHKRTSRLIAVVVTFMSLLIAGTAQAHFIWLAPQTENGKTTVQVYFGEEATPDDPDLLDRLQGLVVYRLSADSKPEQVNIVRTEESLSGQVTGGSASNGLFVAAHTYGVLERGDDVFLLNYYAKTGPALGQPAWTDIETRSHLPLDVVPTMNVDQILVQVRFQGELVKGVEVHASGPGMDDFVGLTDDAGQASFTMADAGLYSLRARHIENVSGELDGKPYSEIRHYSTVAVNARSQPPSAASPHLPPLPQTVTSFGAAVCEDQLYVYGGHTGSAHSYSTAEQANQLRRVSLQDGGGNWETVAEGPHLQGLALVAHGGKLYRIGGFTAKNAEGEDHDLWSQDSVASFDPGTNRWTDLPALPEPRSSHDAAVVGDTIYVVGGWALAGGDETVWHETAWAMDLSGDSFEWKPLPTAPFRRRALAAAAHQGKLYVIGGMREDGGPTTKVDIYDPETQTWAESPVLVPSDGETSQGDMTGFGAAAFATGGRLYVSTFKGDLQRLMDDGSEWEIVGQTPTARFFHRMLPIDDHRLLIVGGANMQVGKYAEIEVVPVD